MISAFLAFFFSGRREREGLATFLYLLHFRYFIWMFHGFLHSYITYAITWEERIQHFHFHYHYKCSKVLQVLLKTNLSCLLKWLGLSMISILSWINIYNPRKVKELYKINMLLNILAFGKKFILEWKITKCQKMWLQGLRTRSWGYFALVNVSSLEVIIVPVFFNILAIAWYI